MQVGDKVSVKVNGVEHSGIIEKINGNVVKIRISPDEVLTVPKFVVNVQQ